MITKITYTNQFNKSFLADKQHRDYATGTINDLLTILQHEAEYLKKVHAVVNELSENLNGANIQEVIANHIGQLPHITPRTKKNRTYSIPCLTIHEQDN